MAKPTYPGVYIEEISSGVRTITGVATSIAAFVGRARKGSIDGPVMIHSNADYEREFGGLWDQSAMSYAVRHYFLNGGRDALIVRLVKGAVSAKITLLGDPDVVVLTAANPGTWGKALQAIVNYDTFPVGDDTLFNLTIIDNEDAGGTGAIEVFHNLSALDTHARYAPIVLEQQSQLVRLDVAVNPFNNRPNPSVVDAEGNPVPTDSAGGDDGDILTPDELSQGPGLELDKQGIYALEKADLFNMLVITPLELGVETTSNVDTEVLESALVYCKRRRAMLLVDPPIEWSTKNAVTTDLADPNGVFTLTRDRNAAVFFPRIRAADPLKENQLQTFAPTGAVAGIMARTDAQRGVWKAPAGTEATILGAPKLTINLTDPENGDLNPLAVNCLRTFAVYGRVVWGSRTWEGADQIASEWKYLPVRRVALFIEESLYRGTQWVVFEPNDEPLWAQIRLNVGAFMHNLFRQGAFQGQTPRDAYFVKCDKETTTQNDINLGIVNILVGFAPLKPAEFVIIKIQQLAGQIAT